MMETGYTALLTHLGIPSKVECRIFDRYFIRSSHVYSKYIPDVEFLSVSNNINAVLHECVASSILILKQLHGDQVIDADEIENFEAQPEGDAAVTSRSNIVLAAQTADCVPILLYCKDTSVIGAVHAGWKGARLGVIGKAVEKMRSKGALEISAIIGPCIRKQSYEVSADYKDSFIAENPAYEVFFSDSIRASSYMFDLPGFVSMKLKEKEVEVFYDLKADTYSNPTRYPSYRRSVHGGIKHKDSILSTILIRDRL
jgi:YfiH family protein